MRKFSGKIEDRVKKLKKAIKKREIELYKMYKELLELENKINREND